MTAILGFIHDGDVWIAGDSAGVSGSSLTVRADKKVFRNGDFLFGFTSSFRMGQLIRYSFHPPRQHVDQDTFEFMVTAFVDELRSCLKRGGFASTSDGEEKAGTFLVGYKGRLFRIDGDYQVAEALDDYAACGCGQDLVLGALAVTGDLEPRIRANAAMYGAERNSSFVRGPFVVEVLEKQ